MNRWLRALAGGVAGSVAIGVTGCGALTAAGDAPSGGQIAAAMRSATSMHVAGHATIDHQLVQVDMSMLRDGSLDGVVTGEGVTDASLLSTGGKVWVKLTPQFLRSEGSPPGVCAKECGKYVLIGSAGAAQLRNGLNMTRFINAIAGNMAGVTYAGTGTVNGQAADKYTDGGGEFIWVAAHGTPYPLLLTGGKSTPGRLAFTQWNSVMPPVPPPARIVLSAG